MAFTVLPPDKQTWAIPSWREGTDEVRTIIELPTLAKLEHSRAHLWRYSPGTIGRRHYQTIQEEVFVVLEGTLTVDLGDPAERHVLGPQGVVILEPETTIHLRNDSDDDLVFFAYGAPADRAAEILDDHPES